MRWAKRLQPYFFNLFVYYVRQPITPHPAANRVRCQPLFAVQRDRIPLARGASRLRCLSGHWLQERPSAHIELRIGRHRFLRFQCVGRRARPAAFTPCFRRSFQIQWEGRYGGLKRADMSSDNLTTFLSTPDRGVNTSIAER